MASRVRDVMTTALQTVRPSDSVTDAARLMREADVGALPVVGADNAPIGIVTDRDIALRVVAEGKDPNSCRVEDVFSRELVTVQPEESLDEALRRMAQHKVRRVAVVDDDRLVGLVAQADVALAGSAKQTSELVEEVSEPTGQPRG